MLLPCNQRQEGAGALPPRARTRLCPQGAKWTRLAGDEQQKAGAGGPPLQLRGFRSDMNDTEPLLV